VNEPVKFDCPKCKNIMHHENGWDCFEIKCSICGTEYEVEFDDYYNEDDAGYYWWLGKELK